MVSVDMRGKSQAPPGDLMAVADTHIARLGERQHGVVARWQLTRMGVGASAVDRRLADGRLHQLHRGVYALGHPRATLYGRWMAAVLAAGRSAALSHRSGAALWEVRRTGRQAIDVTVVGISRRSRRGLTVHVTRAFHPDDVCVRDGIPVTSVPRTLLDLAEVVAPFQLQRAYEGAQRLELLDVRAVERLLARSNGRRGVSALRTLLEYDPAPAAQTASELERRFLDLVRNEGLPTPQVNVLVEGFLVDAYWPAMRMVVELDGYAFHSGARAFERDREKLVRLRMAGYEVLPFTYRQVTESAGWVGGVLRRCLSERAGKARWLARCSGAA